MAGCLHASLTLLIKQLGEGGLGVARLSAVPASGAFKLSGGAASGTSRACESEAQLRGIAAPVARGRGGDPSMFAEGSVEEVEEISSTKAQSGWTLHKFAGTRERLLVLHKHPCGHVCFAVV